MTSSTWAAPEAQDRRQRAEELSDPEFEEDEEDGTDSEAARRAETPARVDQPGRVMACRKKKTRTVFSRSQVLQLESTFDAKRYLSSAERSNLASSLRLTETQVRLVRGVSRRSRHIISDSGVTRVGDTWGGN